MQWNKTAAFGMLAAGALVGVVAAVGATVSAQQSSTPVQVNQPPIVQSSTSQTVDTPEPGDVPDTTEPKTHAHAPLGGDGVVTSINGSTIVMTEESDENGSSYTIDASQATVTNNGVAGSLSDVKVGEKIFVQGTTNGTNVSATSISVGHPGEHGDKVNDTDGSKANEASEPAGTSGQADGQEE